jgi:hypothetical protein
MGESAFLAGDRRAEVKVTAFQAKDGSLRGSSRDIEFPDGRKMDLGGSADTEEPTKK